MNLNVLSHSLVVKMHTAPQACIYVPCGALTLHGPLQWPNGKAATSKARDLVMAPCFPWWSDCSDLIKNTSLATLPGAWHGRIIARTNWSNVRTLKTGWDSKVCLQLLAQCGSSYSCLCRSVPETHFVCCLGINIPDHRQEILLHWCFSYAFHIWS